MTTISPTVASAVPAPPIPTYPQFAETDIPPGSGATRAFRGFIRPFSDDATSHRVARAIEANQELRVVGGRLDSDAIGLTAHPLEPYMQDMAIPCTVMVLEYAGSRHHRAFLLDPFPLKGVSGSQHIWWDKTELIEGRQSPELCIYSGNLFRYDAKLDRLPQFLNQLSTYIAKHLIFLKSRMLHSYRKDGSIRRMNMRKPWQPINLGLLSLSKKILWFGYWIGPAAPHTPMSHLQTVKPDDDCWCNSGTEYKDCHMTAEQNLVAQLERRTNGQSDYPDRATRFAGR